MNSKSKMFSFVSFLLLLACQVQATKLNYTSPSYVNMGTAQYFAVIAYSQVTNSGSTVLNGDLSVYPAATVTGFPLGITNGQKYLAKPVGLTAQGDLAIAYSDAAGRAADAAISGDLAGLTFFPGVYKCNGDLSLSGHLYLDAANQTDAAWIFQVGISLTINSASQVTIINSATPLGANSSIPVWWQVAAGVSIGTTVSFKGAIMAYAGIAVNTGATTGPLLSKTSDVTLLANKVQSFSYPNILGSTTAPSTSPTTAAPFSTTAPSASPSTAPSAGPTVPPSVTPTTAPSALPSTAPVTGTPSAAPVTIAPSTAPMTTAPSADPVTIVPSAAPTTTTGAPSVAPATVAPSTTPTQSPSSATPTTTSGAPSTTPLTTAPSIAPVTTAPSAAPTRTPSTASPSTTSTAPSVAPASVAPSVGPSILPSVAPITVAPSTSTAPSTAPITATPSTTHEPSAAPVTVAPSCSPSFAPSAAPVTVAPSLTTAPSASPSIATTSTPSTTAPSAAPSTAAPSTPAPTNQVAPVVSFDSSVGISGYTGIVNSDNSVTLSSADQTTILQTTAQTMSVPTSSVAFVSASAVVRRMLKDSRALSRTNIAVVVTTTLSMIDYPQYASNATALYNSLSNNLATAASSGTFTTQMQSNAATNGATLATATVPTATSDTPTVQYPPSATPTIAPSAMPSASPVTSSVPEPLILDSTVTYAVIAGSIITSTGTTTLTGNLALSPGNSVTGNPTVTGTQHVADSTASDIQGALTVAYNDAVSRAAGTTVSGDLDGMTLVSGVYKSTSSLTNNGIVYLDAQNNTAACWIFQIATNLVIATGSSIVMKNVVAGSGAEKNVFWAVGTSATVGANAVLKGTVLAYTSVSVGDSAITGPLFASNGEVTLITNTVTAYSTTSSTTTAPTVSPASTSAPSTSKAPSVAPSTAAPSTSTAPSAAPSTATPSVSRAPSAAPSTGAPSAAPVTAAPSRTPSLAPSAAPVTAAPSLTRAPSASPSIATTSTPSIAPSVAPSTATPTNQNAPVVSFASTIGITGYTGNANSDNSVTLSSADQTTIRQTTAQTMSVPTASVTFVSASVVVRRRLRDSRVLVVNNMAVVVTTTLSLIDYPQYASNATALYNALSHDLSTAASSGTYTSTLRTNAATNGATLTTASVPTATSAAPTVQYPPSAAPTSAPKSGNDKPVLSVGAIIGIAIGGGVFLILVLLGCYYMCCKKNNSVGVNN